ncbi:hypothetical protein [Litchfieldella anticariensis]|uniref:endonuclease toxin domain-containing protein n=1 Tax=Litchfieldella anticariensis TaxID=258591 RepID=UPI0035303625
MHTSTAARVGNPRQVYNSLKGNIDAAVNFTEYQLRGIILNESRITARELSVAVPSGTTRAQWLKSAGLSSTGKPKVLMLLLPR